MADDDGSMRLTPAQKKKFLRDVTNRPPKTPERKKETRARKLKARREKYEAGQGVQQIGSPVSDVSAPGVVGSAITGGTIKETGTGRRTKASKASKPKATPAIAKVVDPDSGELTSGGKQVRETVTAGKYAEDGPTRQPDPDRISEGIPQLTSPGPAGVRLEGKGGMPVTDERGKIQRRESLDSETAIHNPDQQKEQERIRRNREEAQTQSGTHSVCTDCFSAVPHHRISTEVQGRNGGICTDCAENYK